MENTPQTLKINADDAELVTCECGAELFTPVVRFRRISPLLSPTQKEELIAMNAFVCIECDKELVRASHQPGGKVQGSDV